MANLQVKNVPDELYAAAKQRAAQENLNLSELVLQLLRRELARPSLQQWVRDTRVSHRAQVPRQIDIEALMDEVRTEGSR